MCWVVRTVYSYPRSLRPITLSKCWAYGAWSKTYERAIYGGLVRRRLIKGGGQGLRSRLRGGQMLWQRERGIRNLHRQLATDGERRPHELGRG